MNYLKFKATLITAMCIYCFPLHAQDKKSATTAPPPAADSDKLDIQKLEQKYWSAKDDDFSVIQNRAFAKEKRWYLSVNYGTPYNDPNHAGNMLGLNVGYFFNERWGLEFNYNKASYKDNDTISEFKSANGVIPNANKYAGAMSLLAYWVPVYAKMSLLDKKIVYFDMGFGFGLGTTNFVQQRCNAPLGCSSSNLAGFQSMEISKNASHFAFNVFQQFFITNRWAIRVDFINRWTTEERLRFGNATTNESIGSKQINDTALQIGLTFWK